MCMCTGAGASVCAGQGHNLEKQWMGQAGVERGWTESEVMSAWGASAPT